MDNHQLAFIGFYLILIGASVNSHHDSLIVTTPKGLIKGSIIESALGRSIYSFRGIRYAKAPTDELRFQPPVPVDSWTGIYDGTKDGASCPQTDLDPISEDCLFLNVYSTKLPIQNNNVRRPVIVYIHAGGFYGITSSSNWAGPHYFLDQDIVLVTINYRLGSLGFISTGDSLAPGNNGLKDQVLTLKWVKENIAAFGGDPNLVTICGYSAGSMSVELHMLSPMSKGLFHRAIAMSASNFGHAPRVTHQLDIAQKQARLVGCPDDTSANIINCLKTKTAKELGDSLPGFAEFGNDPILIWKPVIEPDFGQERFLLEDPIKLVQEGNFAKVPLLSGISAKEFSNSAFNVVGNPALLKEMDTDFERVAPIAFLYERDTENSRNISKQLRKFYLGDEPLTNTSLEGIAKLYADGVTAFPVNRGVKLLSNKNTESTYYYCFSYFGRYSHFYLPGTQTPYGAVHHDELIYMFYISTLFPKFKQSDPEYKMVRRLTTLLTNFAITGKPIPEPCSDPDNVEWIPFTSRNNKYMDIGEKLVMKDNLYKEHFSFWEKLFPLT